MQTWIAFKEVGYTLVAVVLPIALVVLIVLIGLSAGRAERRAREVARGSSSTIGAVAVVGIGMIESGVGCLFQIIVFLALVVNILLATVPFGRSHGWW